MSDTYTYAQLDLSDDYDTRLGQILEHLEGLDDTEVAEWVMDLLTMPRCVTGE